MTEFTIIIVILVINFAVNLIIGELIFKRYLELVEQLKLLNRDIEDIVDKIYDRNLDDDKMEQSVSGVKDED
jgi:hypothetical protein